MSLDEKRKQIFNKFINESYNEEIINELTMEYKLSRGVILSHIRYYAKNNATPKELNLYNKRIHERERFVDYRVGLNKKHPDSHYFKYFKVIVLLCKDLDQYIISDDYSKIINYLENIDVNLKKTEIKRIFFNYLDEMYSKPESEVLKEKINYILEICNCFMAIKRTNVKKEKNRFQKILEAKKNLNLYILELSEENLFVSIDKSKRNDCIKLLENYDKDFVAKFLDKEEMLMKSITEKEKQKIKEIADFVSRNKNSFLDYHLLFNYDLKIVLARARKYQLINCISVISRFYNNYVNQHLFLESTFYDLELKINLFGEDYLISKPEKIIIVNYIKENNFPKTHEIVNQILRKMIIGQIELKNQKHLTKKS